MSQKPKTPRGKRGTYTRVISRTTSESLRLVEPEKLSVNISEPHTPANLTLPPPPKPASSFVVTSVVHSRVDGGIDSPEDESRSDDISRVTDLETPSCSEETYSKDVDEEGASVSFTESAQPPVPSEGYTIVTVPSVLPSTYSQVDSAFTSPTDVKSISVVPQQIASSEEEKSVTTYAKDVFIAKCNRCIGRFQVVKVESIVPFHRGRWTCHDYLDNSKHAPKDGWVFYKERFVKKSDLAKIKVLEQQNISTVITSTVTSVTASSPQHFQEVCQFRTYSTNIPSNSCVTVQSNMQQMTSYPINQPQPAQILEYTVSGQAMASNQSLQYQASDQNYYPVVTTIQQQMFANPSAISSPSEHAPSIFQPQTILPTQPYISQPEYYSGAPYTPQPLTSTYPSHVRIANAAYTAPVQSQYQVPQIAPQNQMFISQSEPPSAQGPSVPLNPFIFPQVPNPHIVQPTFLDSQGNSIQVNQNTRMMTAEQYFPMQTGTNIVPSTISYQHNILQNAPVYQTTVMTTLTITSGASSFMQTGPQYVSTVTSMHTSSPVYQTAGVNSPDVMQVPGSQGSNPMLPVFQNQSGVLNNMNQNVLATQTQNLQVPIQNIVNSQISASNIQQVPMQFVGLQENVPSILGQQIQGSVIHTPPQTPTCFPVQTMHTMPLQNLHVQASVMNTPPETPIMDQPILQSTVLPSQHLASTPMSAEGVLIHPFSSTPCILTNMCYQYLPVVAYAPYAPVISGQFQRQRYNSTPTLSYSWPSSPTYCTRENDNELTDSETNEIIAQVADYLDREGHNQRGSNIEYQETSGLTPVDNKDNKEYIIVVKKDKTSSLRIKETVAPPDLKKDSIIPTQLDTVNPKSNISNVIMKSDKECLVPVTENVITTQPLLSSDRVENDSETLDNIVDSYIPYYDTSSTNIDDASKLLDSEEDPAIGSVRFCLDNIFQKTMQFVEKKLEEALSKEKEKKDLKDLKGPTVSALIDSETGRVIALFDKKSDTYIPPFSGSKSDPLVHIQSDLDYIKTMTFINTRYLENTRESMTSPSEDFADASITAVSQQDWSFPNEVAEVDETKDSIQVLQFPLSDDDVKKTSRTSISEDFADPSNTIVSQQDWIFPSEVADVEKTRDGTQVRSDDDLKKVSVTSTVADFADISITMVSQQDWTFPSEVVEVDKTEDSTQIRSDDDLKASMILTSEDFTDTSITTVSQQDWTFSSEVVEVHKTKDRSDSTKFSSLDVYLKKTSMEILISEESRERILQSCEDIMTSEHFEVASDSCDSQSDSTVIFKAKMSSFGSARNPNLNDEDSENSDSIDVTQAMIEDVSPDTPATPIEDGRFVISLMSDDSDSISINSPESVSATVSPQASGQTGTCSCLEEIHRVTSCASSVIDHKIEQAMDLVKTHLMNSMRAEVESLKARIAELMERIHQLELENDFLKANASPEVLIALNNGAAQIQDTALSYDFITPTTTQSATN